MRPASIEGIGAILIRAGVAGLAAHGAVAAAQGMPGMIMPPAADVPTAAPAGTTMAMPVMLGRYPMTRESSGTAWQPDTSPMTGVMTRVGGGWSVMAEGWVTGLADRQGGPRGDTAALSTSMAMLMGTHELSSRNRVGLRAMVSLDPAMGKRGYPLLFATGETADGRTPLIDRQHPHDFVMELAATLSHDLGGGRVLALYAGLPGEPALGPPTYMHRISGMDDPQAPIGHHWFDSTHITYGVVTLGYAAARWKVEASAFHGREPDQHRWNIEAPRLDSWAVRAFWNPTADLSIQLSTGHLHAPEQLDPETNEQRTTASVTWNRLIGARANWATTLAWSDKRERPGPALTGLLAETALRIGRNEVYARVEHDQEHDLFDAQLPSAGFASGRVFGVGKLSLGYQHEVRLAPHLFVAIGAVGSAYAYPGALRPTYGSAGIKSVMLYGRLRFGSPRAGDTP